MPVSRLTEQSAIVVAHPDDEILWFSSLLANVGSVIICFQEVASQPGWTAGRRESLRTHPLKNVVSLELPESEVFDGAAWPDPIPADYGLEVERSRGWSTEFSFERYKSNFEDVKARLRIRLQGCRNVFTHNPWGEYGHEEHVQVFRAVDMLRGEMGFRLWFSNYSSLKSYGLMLRYMKGFSGSCHSFATRPELCAGIKELYERNGCWTWFPDYRWPREEAFLEWEGVVRDLPDRGVVTPVNLIDLKVSERPARAGSLLGLPRRLFEGVRLRLAVFE